MPVYYSQGRRNLSFSDFNLQKEFITSIEAAGYQSPTPLQSELIPIVAERKSALVLTQSASGKTGAFLIPAMNYILENPDPDKRGARVLILTSRRDRVSQINYTIKRLSSDHVMRFGFIVSGRPYQTQMRLMRRPLDIMIATPGRLNDLMNNGKADFSGLEMLIIDDLTSIYQKNLQELVEKIVEQADDSCTSLTFVRNDDEVTGYAISLFPDAIQISIEDEEHANNKQPQVAKTTKPNNKHNKPDTPQKQHVVKEIKIPQKVHIADDYTHKIAMMDHLLDEFAGDSTVIYTSTHKAAKTLQENLANHGHAAEMVHELSEDEIKTSDILIFCDQEKLTISDKVIADIDTNIIHFDLPRRTDKYLERLSHHAETREEDVLLMVDGYNYNELKHLEKTVGSTIEQITVPGLEPLNPFTNKSKNKPSTNKQNNQTQRRQQPNKAKGKPRQSKPRNNSNKNNSSNRSGHNKNGGNGNGGNGGNGGNANSSNARRQRKGPFGRLNGGANRKKDNTIGVSRKGTDAPTNDRAWQSDFNEPKERKAESKTVTIRYSKKRAILDKPEEI